MGIGADLHDVRVSVADSWVRSSAAGIDPDHHIVPVAFDAGALIDYRESHRLSAVFPLLYDVLGRAAVDCDAVMAVGDHEGKLLWVCGSPAVLDQAEKIRFVEGSVWSEDAAGTNAPGVALQRDEPVTIRGAEHFSRQVHPWSCAAAPIHDPVSRAILGVIDITGGEAVATPQSLAMVHAAARMAEAELGRQAAVRRADHRLISGRAHPAPTDVHLTALGLPEAVIEIAGHTIRLSHRHSEIVIALTRHPEGCSAAELEYQVYPDGRGGSTLRVELGRLRALLGEEVLVSRPYRLVPEVAADWLSVQAYLAAGQVREAISSYHGPLMPGSEAPAVVELRDQIHDQLRRVVLDSGDPNLMTLWTRSRWGAQDLEMWQAEYTSLAPSSPLRSVAQARIDRLDAEFRL